MIEGAALRGDPISFAALSVMAEKLVYQLLPSVCLRFTSVN